MTLSETVWKASENDGTEKFCSRDEGVKQKTGRGQTGGKKSLAEVTIREA